MEDSTTTLPKISGKCPKSLKFENIANGVINTLFIKRVNFNLSERFWERKRGRNKLFRLEKSGKFLFVGEVGSKKVWFNFFKSFKF